VSLREPMPRPSRGGAAISAAARRFAPGLLLGLSFTAAAPAAPAHAQDAAGRLVIIGGGLSRENEAVYRAVLEARNGDGPLCIIPTASASPEGSIESAVRNFDNYGGAGTARGIEPLTVDNPQSASDPAVVQRLRACSGYYFVGGQQSRIVTVFRPEGRPTPAYEAVLERFRAGAVVSGSSAGAAIMSDPMIAGGASGAMAAGVRRSGGARAAAPASPPADPDDEAAEDAGARVSITPGLGFFDGLADQHFLARGRFGRLLVAVLELTEFDVGFGVDENTALVVERGAAWPVGASGVVVVDERGARPLDGGGATGVRVHLLGAGDRFDLATRSVSIETGKRDLPVTGSPVVAPQELFSRWTLLHTLDALGRSPQPSLEVPVPGGTIVFTKGSGFTARSRDGTGVQETPAGLSVTGLLVELRRAGGGAQQAASAAAAAGAAPAGARAAAGAAGRSREAVAATTVTGVDPGLDRLAREIARLAEPAGGTMGVAAVHIETGRAVYLNEHEPFPLASSYKVAIAVQLLARVERGEMRLDSMVTIEPVDLHPGSGTLTSLFDDPGVILSVRNLLELMLLISDNSATDIVLRLAGGGDAVTARLRELGVEGVRVDRPTIGLIGNAAGVDSLPNGGRITMEEYRTLTRRVSSEERSEAREAYASDPRDTATPAGMATLLRRIWERNGIAEESAALILDIMTRSTTGNARIKGILPPRTRVAHKTGSLGGTTNDVGIVTLPDDAGHVIVVTMVKGSDRDAADREAAIAQVARAIHDYFLFNPGVPAR